MYLFAGALTSKPYAFTSRPWELRSVNSVDVLDGIGSNIRIDFKESEIVRILPSRNPEINESWISDKIRFFYDGLKRQRLDVPYVKEHGKLKKAKWDHTLSRFTSSLKAYSVEYGASKIGILSGPNVDCETLYSIRHLASSYGFSYCGVEKISTFNQDDLSFLKFQNQLQDLEKSDFCLLVGTNPRFEASILNLRLRKVFKRGTLEVAAIGGNFNPTYNVNFHGFSAKVLLALAEGKHELCKFLAKAKTPTVFYGWAFHDRYDSSVLVELLKFIGLLFPKILGKPIFINSLHQDSNSVGALELGVPALKKEKLNQVKFIYGVGLESLTFLSKMGISPSLSALQTSHGNENSKKMDFLFPSLSFTEKAGIYYNSEGRPQKSQKALSGPNLSRDDWKILNVLSFYFGRAEAFRTKKQCVQKMGKLLPSSAYPNTWFSKKMGSDSSFFIFGKVRPSRVLKSSFKLPLEDFFMSSSLCHSSKVMAKASEFARSCHSNYV